MLQSAASPATRGMLSSQILRQKCCISRHKRHRGDWWGSNCDSEGSTEPVPPSWAILFAPHVSLGFGEDADITARSAMGWRARGLRCAGVCVVFSVLLAWRQYASQQQLTKRCGRSGLGNVWPSLTAMAHSTRPFTALTCPDVVAYLGRRPSTAASAPRSTCNPARLEVGSLG
jgi:hypothetical protein